MHNSLSVVFSEMASGFTGIIIDERVEELENLTTGEIKEVVSYRVYDIDSGMEVTTNSLFSAKQEAEEMYNISLLEQEDTLASKELEDIFDELFVFN